MKRIALALLVLLLPAFAGAQVYNKFGPAAGVLKGSTSTYQTTAAASSDIIALWSGTCSMSTFLRGDGSCAAAGGGSAAGSNMQMQYNASGSFGASANFTFDYANGGGPILHLNTTAAQSQEIIDLAAPAGAGGVTMLFDDSFDYGVYYRLGTTSGIFNIGVANSTGGELSRGLEINGVALGTSVSSVQLKAAGGRQLGINNNGSVNVNGTVGSPGQAIVSAGSGAAAWTTITYTATSGSIGGGALAAGACSNAATTVTGATSSMVAYTSPVADPGDGAVWLAYVSAADTVTVKVCAIVAMTPTATTYNIRVTP
jgi:hypothetical protein